MIVKRKFAQGKIRLEGDKLRIQCFYESRNHNEELGYADLSNQKNDWILTEDGQKQILSHPELELILAELTEVFLDTLFDNNRPIVIISEQETYTCWENRAIVQVLSDMIPVRKDLFEILKFAINNLYLEDMKKAFDNFYQKLGIGNVYDLELPFLFANYECDEHNKKLPSYNFSYQKTDNLCRTIQELCFLAEDVLRIKDEDAVFFISDTAELIKFSEQLSKRYNKPESKIFLKLIKLFDEGKRFFSNQEISKLLCEI